MQFPGYIVSRDENGIVSIAKCDFDETELTEKSDWTEAHYNLELNIDQWGGRDIDAAIEAAKRFLMKANE
ncbi:MAG: hypothetical protein Q8S26_04550 [Azonexus sp.]|nr:hypothetical protein [Azonexus sp.]